MILENLFAQATQGEIFLRMCLGGLMIGIALHGCEAAGRHCRWLGAAGEIITAALGAAGALGILIRGGSGLRLYALLGMVLGAALYQAGWRPLLALTGKQIRKIFRPAGKQRVHDESM